MSKVVGLMVCGAEADRYLKASLEEFKRLCDTAVIATNNADEATKQMISDYGFWQYEDNREWGKFQPIIKTDLLKKIGKLQPRWILPLDADEVYDFSFTREALEKLMVTKALGYYFYIVNLWNDSGHYWKASGFWNVRAFKFAPEWGLEYIKKNVHCGLAPPYAYHYGRYAPYIVKHYGLMKEEDRRKKVERYAKYDPHGDKVGIGAYYEALKSTGVGSIFKEEEVHQKVVEEVRRMNQKDKEFTMGNENKQFVYIRRLKDGATIDVPYVNDQQLYDQYLKRGFELISKVEVAAPQVVDPPIVDEVAIEQENLECPLCGEKFKTEAGMKTHKTRKHG